MFQFSNEAPQLRAWLDQLGVSGKIIKYYAFDHDPKRRELRVFRQAQRIIGAMTVAQTSFDLFRQFCVLNVSDDKAVTPLIDEMLRPEREYFFITTQSAAPTALRSLEINDLQSLILLALSPANFLPVLNILVTKSYDPSHRPLYQVRGQDRQILAVAGINWESDDSAEVYVHVDRQVRGRGYGRSVVSALVSELMAQGKQPLYLAAENNSASLTLAKAIGFEETALRMISGYARRK